MHRKPDFLIFLINLSKILNDSNMVKVTKRVLVPYHPPAPQFSIRPRESESEREREKEREERERERETEMERDRQRERETERERDPHEKIFN